MDKGLGFEMMRDLSGTVRRILGFADLKKDWDSYGAVPINPLAIKAAVSFVQHLQVVPTCRGGVQLEYHGQYDIEITINEHGRVTAVSVENIGG